MPADNPCAIRVLPDHVANKIAAGEVVERPASVLKELTENSLDAGATRIDVDIVAGGVKLIRVTDNGSGMTRDDALLCVERYATSKIRDVDDIECIATLGFRGEALAAISSVSRFCLKTRRASDLAGTELVMSAGKIQDVRDTGCPQGTSVEVRNLFFNVPARRKFLRSEQTELAHLRQTFLVYALAHPSIGMQLTVDGRVVFALAGQSALGERVRELFPSIEERELRRIDHTAGEIRLTGYAGLPTLSRSDRGDQYVFINGRPASAAIIHSAIREGYHSLLSRDRHPLIFLFLTMDPSWVDVNVHPTKKEVRFRNPNGTRDAIIGAIRSALENRPDIGLPQSQARPKTDAVPYSLGDSSATPRPLPGMDGARTHISFPRKEAMPPSQGPSTKPASIIPVIPETRLSTATPLWSWCRILGQIGNLYVVMETDNGLVLMDPHAAHERVLYDRLMAQVERGSVDSQGLLMAETVELPPKDALRVRQHLEVFRKMGFGIADFGTDSFVVDALPAFLAGVPAKNLLSDLAAGLEASGTRRGSTRIAEELIACSACRSAVKANQALSLKEIEILISQLAETELPYTCPHGRPTLINTSYRELDKRFGRTK